MTNEELAQAIAYAFERCEQPYIGTEIAGKTELGKIMLEHLQTLLSIQRDRAKEHPAPPLCE